MVYKLEMNDLARIFPIDGESLDYRLLYRHSPDGRWLALATGGYVRLIAPDQNDTLPLVFDDLDCAAAVWVNEE